VGNTNASRNVVVSCRNSSTVMYRGSKNHLPSACSSIQILRAGQHEHCVWSQVRLPISADARLCIVARRKSAKTASWKKFVDHMTRHNLHVPSTLSSFSIIFSHSSFIRSSEPSYSATHRCPLVLALVLMPASQITISHP